jgi:hypothetical protein
MQRWLFDVKTTWQAGTYPVSSDLPFEICEAIDLGANLVVAEEEEETLLLLLRS